MSDFTIKEANTDQEILECHKTIVEELRPNQTDTHEYLASVRRQQRDKHYRLLSVRDQNDRVVSILGFQVQENLWYKKTIYIEDFATLVSDRGRGYGDALFKWIMDYAQQIGCDVVHLDSGYGRHDAHRFYLNHGFVMSSHHFVHRINK